MNHQLLCSYDKWTTVYKYCESLDGDNNNSAFNVDLYIVDSQHGRTNTTGMAYN